MAARFALCPSRRRPLLDHYDVPLFESVSVGLLLLAGSRAVKNRATKKITQCLDRVGVQRLPRLPTGIEGSMRPGSGEASKSTPARSASSWDRGLQGRPAACESPHHGPRRGLGLAPRPGQVGVHRRKAGNEMGWRYHPVSGPGRDSPTWQRSPAAAPRKWSGMQWPIAWRASLVCEAIDMAVRNCPERKGRLFSIRIGAASTLLGGSPNISRGTAFLPLRAGPGCAGIMPGSSQWAQL